MLNSTITSLWYHSWILDVFFSHLVTTFHICCELLCGNGYYPLSIKQIRYRSLCRLNHCENIFSHVNDCFTGYFNRNWLVLRYCSRVLKTRCNKLTWFMVHFMVPERTLIYGITPNEKFRLLINLFRLYEFVVLQTRWYYSFFIAGQGISV